MANLINLERVSKSYGVRPLLTDVSLGIAAGERIGIVGRNGDGKTTLLEVMTEIAVLISLFSAGVKMPVPVKWVKWRAPVRLAWVSMTITASSPTITPVLGSPSAVYA